MTPTRRQLCLMVTGAIAVVGVPAQAQRIVYDPTNYASNVLQAARALEQVNNQIRGLQGQATGLANQARNLKSLPFSSLQTIDGNLGRIGGLVQQAQRIAYDVQAIQREFSARYTVQPGASDAALIGAANGRWLDQASAFQHALEVQAGVISSLPGARAQLNALVQGSQGAEGILQAAQAGNQLLALQSQQLTDLAAMMAAQGRATALEQSDRAASRAQAQEQFRRFMDRRHGYEPYPTEMFHQ